MAMKNRTKHNNVSDMVQNLSGDQGFADDFALRIKRRQLVKALAVLRTRADLSQQQLAEKLGCTQSKVSKLESSDDADTRFGDLVDYTGATGHEMRIFLVPKGQTLVDEVKMHAFVIKRLLDKMVLLAGEDGKMTKGVADFLGEAAFNLTRMVQKATAALPPMAGEPADPVQVESPEVEEELEEGEGCSRAAQSAVASC